MLLYKFTIKVELFKKFREDAHVESMHLLEYGKTKSLV